LIEFVFCKSLWQVMAICRKEEFEAFEDLRLLPRFQSRAHERAACSEERMHHHGDDNNGPARERKS